MTTGAGYEPPWCRRGSAGLVVALATVAGLACDPPGAAVTRVPGDPTQGVLNVPYPIAEPERVEGVGRRALAQARYVFVSLGGPVTDRDHGLAERTTSPWPVLVAHHVEPEARAWRPLLRLAFGRVEPQRDEVVEVQAADVEALGLTPPAEAVWLVGPRGTCRARVGSPVIADYPDSYDTLMVGYRLDGCPGRSWSQIGIVAEAIPVDFRWVPAVGDAEAIASYGAAWSEPLAAMLEPPAWPYDDDPTTEVIDVREIPGAEPRMVQARYAWLSALPDEHDPQWCEVAATWTRTDGLYNARWIDPVPFGADATDPFLLGAFVNGSQVDAIIYDDRRDGLVVVPPGPLNDIDDAEAWTHVFVPTGAWDAAALEAWGVQPARSPHPTGPACEADLAQP